MHLDCPQDTIILRLNAELNKTYLWFGARRQREFRAENQAAQDANAQGLSAGVAVQRTITKSGPAYRNSSRDLVDAFAEDADILAEVKEEQLPDAMQQMDADGRQAYLESVADKRTELQRKISELSREREAYLVGKRNKLAADRGGATLGDAIVTAVSDQLRTAGFDTSTPEE